jgi:hypothetical protein
MPFQLYLWSVILSLKDAAGSNQSVGVKLGSYLKGVLPKSR